METKQTTEQVKIDINGKMAMVCEDRDGNIAVRTECPHCNNINSFPLMDETDLSWLTKTSMELCLKCNRKYLFAFRVKVVSLETNT